MKLTKGFRFVTCCDPGRLILCVCKRSNYSGLLEVLFEVYGIVHT